jgi:replicative DNA helicase
MQYVAVAEGLNSRRKLIPLSEKTSVIKDISKDYYLSLYKYNDEHFKKYKETGSVAGIKDTVTDILYFDFDNKSDLELPRRDALSLVTKLEDLGIDKSIYRICYTGQKGFSVEFGLDRDITPDQFKQAVFNLAGDLKTFDPVVNDPNRICRVINTKHPVTGLYKVPLTKQDLMMKTIDEIKDLAKEPRVTNATKKIVQLATSKLEGMLSAPVPEITPVKPVSVTSFDVKNIDWSLKPREWKDYKWALLQGFFKEGDRHNALMVIAATCRGLLYDKETTYYMCKAALKKQAKLTGQSEFDKEELWKNIIETSVFGANWNGGQYSALNNGFLKRYCTEMGLDHNGDNDNTDSEGNSTHTIDDVHEIFTDYATNLDKLTIKFGIPELDRKMRATVGMSIGLIAAAGTGKSSLALAALNFMSKSGELSIFFSYDMYHAIVFQKLVQRHFNIGMDEILLKMTGKKTVYKEEFEYRELLSLKRKVVEETAYTATFDFTDKFDKNFNDAINAKLKEEYANVEFCFTAGQSVEDIQETIKLVEKKRGKKVRFIAIDYNELVSTDLSDSTASSNYVAQKIREIAIVNSLCALQLFQPTKLSGTPADEIKSYHAAKGGGGIAQSVSIMLTMSRPGYSPDHPEDDLYARINCVKNRLGPLFKVDLGFHGLTGSFRTLSEEEKGHLKAIIDDRDKERAEANSNGF